MLILPKPNPNTCSFLGQGCNLQKNIGRQSDSMNVVSDISMLPAVLFLLTAHFETCAIYDETHETVWESINATLHIHGLIPAGQGCVIRAWEIQIHQSE